MTEQTEITEGTESFRRWSVLTMSGEVMQGGDAAQTGRVMNALMQMDKLDLATLKSAADQR